MGLFSDKVIFASISGLAIKKVDDTAVPPLFLSLLLLCQSYRVCHVKLMRPCTGSAVSSRFSAGAFPAA